MSKKKKSVQKPGIKEAMSISQFCVGRAFFSLVRHVVVLILRGIKNNH
jgi:hypothetical protein